MRHFKINLKWCTAHLASMRRVFVMYNVPPKTYNRIPLWIVPSLHAYLDLTDHGCKFNHWAVHLMIESHSNVIIFNTSVIFLWSVIWESAKITVYSRISHQWYLDRFYLQMNALHPCSFWPQNIHKSGTEDLETLQYGKSDFLVTWILFKWGLFPFSFHC